MLRSLIAPFALVLLALSCSSEVPPVSGSPAGTGRDGTTGVGGTTGTGEAAGTGGSDAGGVKAGAGGDAGSGGSGGAESTVPSDAALQAGDLQISRSSLAHDTAPTLSESDYSAFIDGTTDFAFDLFGKIAPAGSNFLFSPISVQYALAMTLAGAKGDTASQMKAAMHETLDDAVFDTALNKLAIDFASRNVEPTDAGPQSLRLRLVDSAWAQREYQFLPAYLDTLGQSFDAGMYLVDFVGNAERSRVLINEWVADQTAQKIKDLLLPNNVTSLTRLVLVNALYFYGSWATPFRESSTKDASFHAANGTDVTVKMMGRADSVPYTAGTDYQMIDLAYLGNHLTMSIVLPADGKFDAVRNGMSRAWLNEARSSLSSARGNIYIPRFKFTWGTASLVEALQKLGIRDAFVPPPGQGKNVPGTADFSGMEALRELYISDVLHKAFIAVDEAGTEAAAATAVVMTKGNASPDSPASTFEFKADRPFLIVIRDSSGALLFCGQVVDPTAES